MRMKGETKMYYYFDDDYEYSKTPQARYDKANTTFISLRCDNSEDTDILKALEGKPKQTQVKRLVRLGIGRIRFDKKRAEERAAQNK